MTPQRPTVYRKPQKTNQRDWVRAQLEIPLAWPDDPIVYAGEVCAAPTSDDKDPRRAKEVARLRQRVIDRAYRYVRGGHVPQLRMVLADGDTVNGYLRAFGDHEAIRAIRRRAATHMWNAGGAAGSPNPKGSDFRSPNLPYLRAMLAATYDDAEPYNEPKPTEAQLSLDDPERDR